MVSEFLGQLPTYTTDYWAGEKYYLMMCVEKGDLLSLFELICREYHVPVVSSKGWPPILLRTHVARLSQRAEADGITPVLLLFYDHDPAGLKITDTFRKNLEDCRKGTGWSPDLLIIKRFGLNEDDIERYNLTWIENLKTGSGKEAHDEEYIERFGKKKCESNALFKNDETLKAGEEICRKAIEKYYGSDARERFKRKEERSKRGLEQVYKNSLWMQFDNGIDELVKFLADKKIEKKAIRASYSVEKEIKVIVDNEYYGRCPRCGEQFNYSEKDDGRLVRCRSCQQPMRLKLKSQQES